MIIALLFLILFAILFPKALRFLFALLFIGVIVALGAAHADPARTKTGLCVGDYSLKQMDGHFVARHITRRNCPTITIKEDALTIPAAVDCQDIAAHQVASEPGIKECLAAPTAHFSKVSPDCHAVIKASMTKRIHECEKAVAEFNKH